VVADGVAVTELPLVLDNPVDGIQVYDAAPAAVSKALLPLHTIVFGVTETLGDVVTCTATVDVLLQPLLVPVTV
jgi:hypothetical protein